MGKKDLFTTRLMQKNQTFADAFNYCLYGGEQVIDPDKLVELDTKDIMVPYGGIGGASQPVQRMRDVIKSWVAMSDSNAAYLIMGIENQSHVAYAMPVRNMVYDAINYAKQVEEAINSHRKSGDYGAATDGEFLSGFMKSDHLIPVVTLVIYWSAAPWDGPMSIHEMYEYTNDKILEFIPDYKINLISPAALKMEDMAKFHSPLKYVLSFIKHSKDAARLEELISSDDGFHNLGRDEVNVLNACVDARIKIEEGKETVNMCEALEQIRREAARKAAEETTKEVTKEVTKEMEQKRIDGMVQMIHNLIVNQHLTTETALDSLGISENDRKIITPLL
ncbi:MAG: hypothetical protein LIO37_02390 [Clostridiales bacterium]|nr:hypothetical protein [Clostridiales bacterium]